MLKIMAVGGIRFHVYDDGDFLGVLEFGSLDDAGQYKEDDDEIIAEAREAFDFEANYPAVVE